MGQRRVLISGGGIAGLATALALLQRGIDVQVYERSADPPEVGAGLQLSPNGSRVLISLGLGPAMERVAWHTAGKEIRLWNTGQTWPMEDLGVGSAARYGAPYWMVHRGDLYGTLLDAVRERSPNAVRPGIRCIGIEQGEAAITMHLSNGGAASGDAVIGADGVHSRVRRAMFGASAPEYTGLMAWRGIAPMARLPAGMRRSMGTHWIGTNGHVLTFPLRRGEILNVVCVVARRDWCLESWSQPGDAEEWAADLAGWHEDVRTIVRAVEAPFKWALLSREPLRRFAQGRACLVGDAAHPALPLLGQGACMAIEDALVLARCLDDSATGVPDALARFESARVLRTAAILRASAANARRLANPAFAEPCGVADFVAREWTPQKLRQDYEWLFDYDAVNAAV
jgi:salicylate hydroxylase